MLITNFINIWRKELTYSLRDRKALSETFLLTLFIDRFYSVLNASFGRLV